MLHIPDQPTGRGPTRREWLRLGGLGCFGLTLPTILRAETPLRNPKPILLFLVLEA